jgi:SPP1 gp7 family putative phage head morphogenesis protein
MPSKTSIPKIVASIKPQALSKRAIPVVKETIQFFGSLMVSDVGGDSFNVNSPSAKAYLKKFGAEKITRINNSTKVRINNLLVREFEKGSSIDAIAKQVSDKFDQWSEGRAWVMAKTEINGASNFGAHEGMVQAGVEQKEWLATNDDAVRETHAELDGTVIDIDEEFESSSGATALYPGDFGEAEEDVNCRCGVLPVISDKRMRHAHRWLWKALEQQRKPFDRKLHKAFKGGFAEQKAAVLSALANAA